MLVTINTDASFYKKESLGSYAFWAVSNNFKIMKFGVLRKKCHRAEEAEMKCIINALHVVLSHDKSIRNVIVNTDCLNAIHIFTEDKKQINYHGLKWGEGLKIRYKMLIMGYKKVKVEFRHVKAHVDTKTARTWVNDWCDRKAKEALFNKVNGLAESCRPTK